MPYNSRGSFNLKLSKSSSSELDLTTVSLTHEITSCESAIWEQTSIIDGPLTNVILLDSPPMSLNSPAEGDFLSYLSTYRVC